MLVFNLKMVVIRLLGGRILIFKFQTNQLPTVKYQLILFATSSFLQKALKQPFGKLLRRNFFFRTCEPLGFAVEYDKAELNPKSAEVSAL